MARLDATSPNADLLRYARIRHALILRASSFAAVAKRLHLSRSMVGKVAAGSRKSKRVREALARAIGIPYKELWV